MTWVEARSTAKAKLRGAAKVNAARAVQNDAKGALRYSWTRLTSGRGLAACDGEAPGDVLTPAKGNGSPVSEPDEQSKRDHLLEISGADSDGGELGRPRPAERPSGNPVPPRRSRAGACGSMRV